MYKAKYKYKLKFDSDGKRKERSSLDTKFNFWNEIIPKDRPIIKKRIKDFTERKYTHFVHALAYAYKIRHLGFHLNIWADRHMGSEDMADFDRISSYILTGKE